MTHAELPLLIALLPLLAASAFFSGSETALFGLITHERIELRRRGGLGATATEALLKNPRMLLITILLGNMTVNVVFFVISSVLALRAPDPLWATLFSIVPLLALIVAGEVLPKVVATSNRARWCQLFSPSLLGAHRSIAPLRSLISAAVIEPLSRIVKTPQRSEAFSASELCALLELSHQHGVIEADEARLLGAVTQLGELSVRDVMTPRVKMRWLPESARRGEVLAMARDSNLTKIPLCAQGVDQGVTSVVDVREFLPATAQSPNARAASHAYKPLFAPEQATLDQLLGLFRTQGRQFAIVLDEFGGVSGVVTVGDVVERLLPSLSGDGAPAMSDIERTGEGTWRVPGWLSAHDWTSMFDQPVHARAATVAGLVIQRLGRIPAPGDTVTLGNIRLTVESMQGAAIESLVIELDQSSDDSQSEAPT